jgi:acyl carrier protein
LDRGALMSKNKSKIKELILDVMNIDLDKIDQNKNLTEIGEWDSFNNLMLISRMESEFKVKFSVKEIEETNTIKKIIELVDKKTS